MTTLDCRNQQCPGPVIATRKALLDNPEGTLSVLVNDETARENVSRLATSMGFAVDAEGNGDEHTLNLTPGAGPLPNEGAAAIQGKTVLFVTSDCLGEGDPELGRILLRNFLITLNEASSRPDTILFLNAGVKLTVEGAETIEALNRLACDGVDIAACGLCLEFYNLKEKLAVGRISNMLETIETLQSAGRIIRP
ncbi:MAG: sulfurtransferase-like selenium metabolism protein YedF [Desulfuromonas sp.]|nr:MAG: sulfurtransferase-like selenium metabolism protein YedF [Desulfuromonas sp.]